MTENTEEKIEHEIHDSHEQIDALSQDIEKFNTTIDKGRSEYLKSQTKFQSALERLTILSVDQTTLQETVTEHQQLQQNLISNYVDILNKLQMRVILKQKDMSYHIEEQASLQKKIVRSHRELQKNIEELSRKTRSEKEKLSRKRF